MRYLTNNVLPSSNPNYNLGKKYYFFPLFYCLQCDILSHSGSEKLDKLVPNFPLLCLTHLTYYWIIARIDNYNAFINPDSFGLLS